MILIYRSLCILIRTPPKNMLCEIRREESSRKRINRSCKQQSQCNSRESGFHGWVEMGSPFERREGMRKQHMRAVYEGCIYSTVDLGMMSKHGGGGAVVGFRLAPPCCTCTYL